jgi:GMP synthase (glutamine-hydrolysing)
MDGAGCLILLGGPMGVYEAERYPFLADEIRLVERALREDKPVLGVCLGSQLLASALGAEVSPSGGKEIGWHPVTLTGAASNDPIWGEVESPLTAYHWHGDVFELPKGAVSLASSRQTECQAYRYGQNAYGILFHLEVTREIVEDMVAAFGDELRAEGLDGGAILSDTQRYLPELQRVGKGLFNRWARLISVEISAGSPGP